MSTGATARGTGSAALRWGLNLAVPLTAAALVFAGVVVAQGEELGGLNRASARCTELPTTANTSYGSGLGVAPTGDVYVLEAQARCLVRIDTAGVGHFAAGHGSRSDECPACGVELGRPQDVEVGPDGTVYVADRFDTRVIAIAPDGTTRTAVGDTEAVRPYFQAFTLDGTGRLYVADRETVQRYDPSGPVVVAGGGGSDVGGGAPATSVRLARISAMTVAPDGSLYLLQEYLYRVLKVDPAGRISLFAGTGVEGDTGDGGPATEANINPAGIAVDEAGNVYLAIQYGHRIRRVDTSGRITTWAGTGVSGFSGDLGDGGPAARARFSYPTDLEFSGGSLYVLDGARVRRIDKAGIVTSLGAPAARS